jgi:chromosome partitioning protein
MKIICVANQKGGAGKTTLTAHLAVAAQKSGLGEVALIDTDPQGSLADWWNERQEETPRFVSLSLADLKSGLQELKTAGFSLVFIDTPPVVSETISQVIAHADIVVIPSRPSPLDLRAVGKTISLVEAAEKNMVFVVNGATQRAKITADAAVALSQYGKVAPVMLYQRVDFAQSMTDGRVAQELDGASKAAEEIAQLLTYLRKQLRI